MGDVFSRAISAVRTIEGLQEDQEDELLPEILDHLVLRALWNLVENESRSVAKQLESLIHLANHRSVFPRIQVVADDDYEDGFRFGHMATNWIHDLTNGR